MKQVSVFIALSFVVVVAPACDLFGAALTGQGLACNNDDNCVRPEVCREGRCASGDDVADTGDGDDSAVSSSNTHADGGESGVDADSGETLADDGGSTTDAGDDSDGGRLDAGHDGGQIDGVGWRCEASLYGDGTCHCGCGIVDIDCPEAEVFDCEAAPICEAEAKKLPYNLVQQGQLIDPNDLTRCNCNASFPWTWDDGDSGHCTCPAQATYDPQSGFCLCSDLESEEAPFHCWTCGIDPNDEECSCGCGQVDPTCKSPKDELLRLSVCDARYCEGPDAVVPFNLGHCSDTHKCGNAHVDLFANEECDPVGHTGNGICRDDCRLVPVAWSCAIEFYDEDDIGPNEDFCDCGCGIDDPDCPFPYSGLTVEYFSHCTGDDVTGLLVTGGRYDHLTCECENEEAYFDQFSRSCQPTPDCIPAATFDSAIGQCRCPDNQYGLYDASGLVGCSPAQCDGGPCDCPFGWEEMPDGGVARDGAPCRRATCGNEHVDEGEDCDDPNSPFCTLDCRRINSAWQCPWSAIDDALDRCDCGCGDVDYDCPKESDWNKDDCDTAGLCGHMDLVQDNVGFDSPMNCDCETEKTQAGEAGGCVCKPSDAGVLTIEDREDGICTVPDAGN